MSLSTHHGLDLRVDDGEAFFIRSSDSFDDERISSAHGSSDVDVGESSFGDVPVNDDSVLAQLYGGSWENGPLWDSVEDVHRRRRGREGGEGDE